MIIFAPTGNDSANVCAGLDAYESARPSPSDLFQQFNLAVFIYSICLWSLSLAWFWRYREAKRLRIVRPFFANVITCVAHMFFAIAMSLGLARQDLPCSLTLVAFFLWISGGIVHLYITIIIYLLESHFAQNVGKYAVLTSSSANGEDRSEVTEKTPVWRIQSNFLSAFLDFLKVAVGAKSLEALPFTSLLVLKKRYPAIALMIALPSVIPLSIILGTSAVYRTCVGCAFFLEPLLGFLALYLVYALGAIRIIWLTRSAQFIDTQGLYEQLLLILIPAGPLVIAVIVLTIVDPGNASFNRTFMYFEWIMQFVMLVIYWGGMVLINVYKVHRAQKNEENIAQLATTRSSGANVMDDLETNPELSSHFETYAKNHFAVETYYFMRDVRAFKQAFYDKTDMWRLHRVKQLVETYIRHNALMEINISHDIRKRIIDRFGGITATSSLIDLYTLFDEAFTDVGSSILFGLWQSFIASKPTATVSPTSVAHSRKLDGAITREVSAYSSAADA